MLAAVKRAIDRQRLIEPGERVAVAASGGSDSTALLLALRELAPKIGFELRAAHLNHGLRGAESNGDEQFVREVASRQGVQSAVHRIDTREAAGGGNLEAAARRLRYGWFRELIASGWCDKVATGHTRSDQAETVLFRLLRGAGARGLIGVKPRLAGRIIRPMLAVSRREIRCYLEARGQDWREDSSNLDLSFRRNRLRRELLPWLEREWNPSVEAALAHTAVQALDDESCLEGLAAQAADKALAEAEGTVMLRLTEVAALHPALQRRLLRLALERVPGRRGELGFGHIERLRELCLDSRGEGSLDLPGVLARRSFDQLRLSRKEAGRLQADARSNDVIVEPPTSLPAPDRRGEIDFVIVPQLANTEGYNEARWVFLDWEKTPRPLRLRSWRPGDRFRIASDGEERKLKFLWQASKTPIWEREAWPVLTSPIGGGAPGAGERLVWARGFGVAGDLAADASSRRLLAVRERRDQPEDFRGISRPFEHV